MMTWTWRMIWATAISCRHLIQRTVHELPDLKMEVRHECSARSRVTDSQSMVKAMSQSGGFRSLREATRLCCSLAKSRRSSLWSYRSCLEWGAHGLVSRAVESSVAVGRSKMEGIWRNVYRMLNPFRLCETLIPIIFDLILGKGIGRSDGNGYRLGLECVQFVRNPAGGRLTLRHPSTLRPFPFSIQFHQFPQIRDVYNAFYVLIQCSEMLRKAQWFVTCLVKDRNHSGQNHCWEAIWRHWMWQRMS
jgi:hypothetical protein